MPFDYSQAPDPRDFSELIPHGTIATVQMRLRPGNVGEDGICKRTKAGDAEFLDAEFVLVDGPYVSLKDFDNLIFIAKIGVRKGGPKNDGSGESWSDKNVLLGAIGPEHKEWHPV